MSHNTHYSEKNVFKLLRMNSATSLFILLLAFSSQSIYSKANDRIDSIPKNPTFSFSMNNSKGYTLNIQNFYQNLIFKIQKEDVNNSRFLNFETIFIKATIIDGFIEKSKDAFIKFHGKFKELFIFAPEVYLIIILCFNTIANFFRSIFSPEAEYNWRRKIIADIVRINKESIDWVENELIELPKRRKQGHAIYYVHEKPIEELLNIKGIGKVTLQKIKELGFDNLARSGEISNFVNGIGSELQRRIDEFVSNFIDKSFLEINYGILKYENSNVNLYFDELKKRLLDGQDLLNKDVKEIVELTDELDLAKKELDKISFADRLKLYLDKQKKSLSQPFRTVIIVLIFAISSLSYFFVPLPLFILPWISLPFAMYLGAWLVGLILLWLPIKYNFFSEFPSFTNLGEQINPHNLKEQRLQLEALKLSIKFGIKTPEVRIISNDSYNAFAAGGRYVKSIICFHSSLIEDFSWDEVRAIMGHEMGHLKSGDSRKFSIHASANSLLELIAISGFRIHSVAQNISFLFVFTYVYAFVNYWLINVLRFFIKVMNSVIDRSMEYRADLAGAEAVSYEAMISSLESLTKSPKDDEYFPMFRAAYINDISQNVTGAMAFGESLFSTHPSIEKRISALRKKSSPVSKKSQEVQDIKIRNLKDLI